MRPFHRLSGGGNDFLALVEQTDPTSTQVAAWCRRGASVGADGVFTLNRRHLGDQARVAMSYWNADGRPADLCLNGARCAARLAFELGWAAGQVEIATAAGLLHAERRADDLIAVEVPLPPPPTPLCIALEGRSTLDASGSGASVSGGTLLDGTVSGAVVTIGVPHFVEPRAGGLAGLRVGERGRALRWHRHFAPAGTNVDFVVFAAPDRLEIRTFERGVEAETLACGTGVLAATWVGLSRAELALPVEVTTLGNFPLRVEGRGAPQAPTSWALCGDARVVASGQLHPGSEAMSATPAWTR